MKRIIYFSVLLALVSCNRIPEEKRVLEKDKADKVFVMQVPKARCANCQKVIEGGLQNVAGVKQSILNLHTKEVSVVYKPEEISKIDLEEKVKTLKGQIPCK
ncbi:MAG: hypothetical protein ED556_08095 [Winogradskyella sp.]|uniref:cation transporter n=1 Tax=Winogradskyella sp. TaxID=1883156 RepID=UPI000F3EAF8A|nr:cation transporter [Winogradskyella sp.]RNC86250.1 MAG: hypothetical protein ED556_08095 [Winogradskyella sp.]